MDLCRNYEMDYPSIPFYLMAGTRVQTKKKEVVQLPAF